MPLKPSARAFVVVVTTAGALAIAWAIYSVVAWPPGDRYWLVLLALTCFTSTFSVRVPGVVATISVSETFVFLCALLYGPAPATIVIALDGALTSYSRRHRRAAQMAFNIAEPPVALVLASMGFALVAGHPMAVRTPHGASATNWSRSRSSPSATSWSTPASTPASPRSPTTGGSGPSGASTSGPCC